MIEFIVTITVLAVVFVLGVALGHSRGYYYGLREGFRKEDIELFRLQMEQSHKRAQQRYYEMFPELREKESK